MQAPPFTLLPLHHGTDSFELRGVVRRHLPRSGIEEIKAVFKVTSVVHIFRFEELMTEAVRKLGELVQENPDFWCLQVSNSPFSPISAYINYNPTTTDIGNQVLNKIHALSQHNIAVHIGEALYLTIITAPRRRNR